MKKRNFLTYHHRLPTIFAFSLMNAPNTPLSVQTILAPIDEDMQATNALIRTRLHSEVALVNQVSDYIIHSGGKRLRPALLLACARACGYDSGSAHHELAAVIEFIHTATLLHDDVVDESALRRGNQSANALFGNAAAVLVGDFLYSRAFQMMVRVDNIQIMQVLADATNVIAEGEVLQLLNSKDASLDVAGYLRVIRYKTAKLFEAAARLAAILANADAALQKQMAGFGMHLGTAFQIIDDVLDYTADEGKLGKKLGEDLAEGKTTLPLIFAMQDATPADAALIAAAIEDDSGSADFARVHEIILQTSALAQCREVAQAEIKQANAALATLSASIFKDALLELSAFAISRDY